jgi:glutathione-regulated potassium-efflux system ancillary protein KefG
MTLFILSHDNFAHSIGNKLLWDTAQETVGTENNTFIHLESTYPALSLSDSEVKQMQELLVQHDQVVLQFPMQWYSTPALMKKWLDQVMGWGFAFGPNGDKLTGKKLQLVVTTGSGSEAYTSQGSNGFSVEDFLLPLKRSATMFQMEFLPVFVAYGMAKQTPESLSQLSLDYSEFLKKL